MANAMQNMNELYPQGPAQVPRRLTKVTMAYRLYAVATMLSIALFIVFFWSLVLGSFWLGYQILMFQITVRLTLFYIFKFLLGVIVGSIGFFALKMLFKQAEGEDPFLVELDLKANPHLHAFLKQVARDTRSRMPHKVFYAMEVNAAVISKVRFYNAIIPPRRNLVIGMGLVNALNISEFKATIAHEFGHFAQGTQRLGTYVHLANRSIFNIVHLRDSWDDYLESATKGNFTWGRIFVHLLQALIWGLRQSLGLFYRLINYFESKLSREMEFNADLVAVSVAGADAIRHTLYKVQHAGTAFSDTFENLVLLAQQSIFTDDMYVHHASMITRRLQENPVPSTERLFEPDDSNELPLMYASHPSNYLREQNILKHKLPADTNPQSAWGLFQTSHAIRETLNNHLNDNLLSLRLGQKTLPAAEVEAYLQEERDAQQMPERYKLLYELHIPTQTKVNQQPHPGLSSRPSKAEIDKIWETIAMPEARKIHLLHGEWKALLPLFNGEKRLKKIIFRGREYKEAQIAEISKSLIADIDKQYERLEEVAQIWYAVVRQMALNLPAQRLQDYDARWAQHAVLSEMFRNLGNAAEQVGKVVEKATARPDLSEKFTQQLEDDLENCHKIYLLVMRRAENVQLLPMVHVEAGKPLEPMLQNAVTTILEGTRLTEGWVNEFMALLQRTIPIVQNLHVKNLVPLLVLCEEIEHEYLAMIGNERAADGGAGQFS